MPDVTGKHIVSTDWLATHLGAPDLVVLDGSWHLPAEKRDAKAEFSAAHIPGARFFDIDTVSDKTSSLPHMMPSAEQFAVQMQALGVGEGDCVVVYDASAPGLMSGGRVWWMLRAFGHTNVAVLDGGLRKWKAEGRPLTADPAPPRSPRPLGARLDPRHVRTLDEMRALVAAGGAQIADARGPGRFEGREPEPRPGLRSGHMPGARNVPFSTLLKADGTLKPKAELARVFQEAGIDVTRPVVTSCGSGVSAAVLTLALAIIGRDDTGLYDGSWSEWGQEKLGTPVATGR
jgi:thiosulfate/3-mercaptopyruvate sulfurtransferase